MVLASGLTAAPAVAGTATTLYQFTGGSDGATPPSSLTYDEKGDLYGVAEDGGNVCTRSAVPGCGTVYKLSPSGQEKTLVAFAGTSNGANPQGPLTLVNHNLYGSASAGGALNVGVLFSVHADGTRFRLLHTFDEQDGMHPVGPLVPGPAGAFYGITLLGGPNMKHAYSGVLFELLPDGTYIQLHDFTGGADGSEPNALLIGASGTLYGSTNGEAPCQGEKSCGVAFEYVPSTGAFTVLHQFVKTDGIVPMLGSIGPDGTLYGATGGGGGGAYEQGSLFELMPAGGAYSLTTLYWFDSDRGPGNQPSGGPILTSYGALMGALKDDGNGSGALYRFKFNKIKDLYTFPMPSNPAPPIEAKNGTIYGAGSVGGIAPCNKPGVSIPLGCGFVYGFVQ